MTLQLTDFDISAERGFLSGFDPDQITLPDALQPMMEATAAMLRESLDAFVRADPGMAREVMDKDDVVDDFNRVIIDQMVERMKADSNLVDDALLFLSASKNLERIADHATNIAEDVVYMVEGDIIRHQSSL